MLWPSFAAMAVCIGAKRVRLGAQVGRLFDAAKRYMALRPRGSQPALRPFFESRGEGDAAAASDSGGASFLGQVTLECIVTSSVVRM